MFKLNYNKIKKILLNNDKEAIDSELNSKDDLYLDFLVILIKNDELLVKELVKIMLLNEKVDLLKTIIKNKLIEEIKNKKQKIEIFNLLLRMSAFRNYIDLVYLLINNEFLDPILDDNYALRVACSKGYLDIVKALIKDKKIKLTKNENGFYFALLNNHLDMVCFLINHKSFTYFDIIERNIDKILKGDINIVKLLSNKEKIMNNISLKSRNKIKKKLLIDNISKF